MRTALKIAIFSVILAFTSLLLGEVAVRLFFRVSTQDRADFVKKAWDWPITAFPSFDGPLRAVHVAHPFWGFHKNPKLGHINSFGFHDDIEYPYPRQKDELIIGLLGGSVAMHTHRFLVDYLTQHISTSLKPNCKVKLKVMNLAQGGHKQPSQFHIFSYFIDNIDMAINIDGHNDVIFDPGGLFPAAYPPFVDELYNTTDEKYQTMAKAYSYEKVQYVIAENFNKNPDFLHSDLIFVLSRALFSYLENQKRLFLTKASQSDGPLRYQTDEETRRNELVAIWKKYVSLQAALSKEFKKKSFFFLQPSQYAENSKILSTEEKDTAIIKDPRELSRFQKGFKAMRIAQKDLANHGVDIEDFSRLFANEKETLFIDSCCHLNDEGGKRLAKAVADRALSYINKHYCP